MKLFERASIGSSVLKNRIIRSATYEGMCDGEGFPTEKYRNHYSELARNEVGGIITGFAYTSKTGRAMQPGQAAIDAPSR